MDADLRKSISDKAARFELLHRAGTFLLPNAWDPGSAMLLADSEPEAARALTVDALMLEAEANGVDLAGKAMLLGTAHDLAPESPEVGAAIAALDVERGRSTAPLRKRLALALLGLVAALGLLSRVAVRLHRPSAPGPRTT